MTELWRRFRTWVHEGNKRGAPLSFLSREPPRSGHWPALEREFLAEHPTCAACSAARDLNVHHVQPFHLVPSLELDPTNLITLCAAPNWCHLLIGHGDSFRAYNPTVREDAAAAFAHPELRPQIIAAAKACRAMKADAL